MTYAVFFDVLPKKGFADAYFGMAGGLKPIVEKSPGFISVERFENLERAGWYLSFSRWQDEQALGAWRCQHDHHEAQVCGRNLVLEDYRLRVASIRNERFDKSCIFAIVGDFDVVKEVANSATASFEMQPRVFRGVINPARGISLIDCHFEQAQKVKTEITDLGLIEMGVYEVQRDYGMFDRAQAPTVFA